MATYSYVATSCPDVMTRTHTHTEHLCMYCAYVVVYLKLHCIHYGVQCVRTGQDIVCVYEAAAAASLRIEG